MSLPGQRYAGGDDWGGRRVSAHSVYYDSDGDEDLFNEEYEEYDEDDDDENANRDMDDGGEDEEDDEDSSDDEFDELREIDRNNPLYAKM